DARAVAGAGGDTRGAREGLTDLRDARAAALHGHGNIGRSGWSHIASPCSILEQRLPGSRHRVELGRDRVVVVGPVGRRIVGEGALDRQQVVVGSRIERDERLTRLLPCFARGFGGGTGSLPLPFLPGWGDRR